MAEAMTGRANRWVPGWLLVHVRRLVRYGAVSIISSALGLAVLGFLVGVRGTSAGWANVISTTFAAIPSFELNRRWSWQGRSGRAKVDQVVPFFVMTFLGLGLSTYVVHWAGLIATEHQLHRFHRTVAIEGASLGTWAALWLVQYLILDRFLFRPPTARPEQHGLASLPIDPIDATAEAIELVMPPDPLPPADDLLATDTTNVAPVTSASPPVAEVEDPLHP